MITSRVTLSLLVAASFTVVLAGCQSNSLKNSTLTASSVSIEPEISQEIVQNKAPTAEKETVVIVTPAVNPVQTNLGYFN